MPEKGSRRVWIYASSVRGRYQRIHRFTALILQLWLFVTPWVTIGGHPAVLLDLAHRRLYAFGAVFTPHDAVLIVLILLMMAFSLFFFTALYGRLWCGYACPQTVFLEEWVRPLERWIEGDRGVRMRRDAGPWTWDRAWRKVAKTAALAAMTVVIAGTLLSWFVPAREVWTGQASALAYALAGAVGVGIFLDLAWFREQLCNYLCPYARFQGALTDDHSLRVAYDALRGEPRGRRPAAEVRADRTALCVDCNRCVTTCPQGIDIREGFQLECVACARCVDACEEVMGRLGHESLIRYTTLAAEQGRPPRAVRIRTVAYAGLIAASLVAFLVMLGTRHDLEATASRAPGTLYTVDPDGWVRNTFLLQVESNRAEPGAVPIAVSLEGLPEAELLAPAVTLDPAGSQRIPVIVRVPPGSRPARTVNFELRVATPSDAVVVPLTFKSDRAQES